MIPSSPFLSSALMAKSPILSSYCRAAVNELIRLDQIRHAAISLLGSDCNANEWVGSGVENAGDVHRWVGIGVKEPAVVKRLILAGCSIEYVERLTRIGVKFSVDDADKLPMW